MQETLIADSQKQPRKVKSLTISCKKRSKLRTEGKFLSAHTSQYFTKKITPFRTTFFGAILPISFETLVEYIYLRLAPKTKWLSIPILYLPVLFLSPSVSCYFARARIIYSAMKSLSQQQIPIWKMYLTNQTVQCRRRKTDLPTSRLMVMVAVTAIIIKKKRKSIKIGRYWKALSTDEMNWLVESKPMPNWRMQS